jgi:hypothetical protein
MARRDVFEAGEHDAGLGRTGRGVPELDLKRPEQPRVPPEEVPQLASGDHLRHPISPLAGGGSQRFKSGETGGQEHCPRVMWGHRWWREQAMVWREDLSEERTAPGSRTRVIVQPGKKSPSASAAAPPSAGPRPF